MPDWFTDNAPKAAAPSGGDWFDLYSPDRKPASTEDFTPPAPSKGWPAKLGDAFAGFGKSLVSGAIGTGEALSDLQRAAVMGDTDASARTLDRVKGIGRAQLAEIDKANTAPTTSEKLGHAAAGVFPVLGPAAAQAGEHIAAGNDEGYGEAAALIAPFGPAEVVAKGLPPALRAAQTVGKAAGDAAMKAAPIVGPIAADVALHHYGAPPVVTAIKLIKGMMDAKKAPKVAEEPLVTMKPHGGPIRVVESPDPQITSSRIPYRVEDRPAPSPNAGGQVVPAQTPTLTDVLSGALDKASQPEPPARITTPPPAGLPPGYTPRSTVPKPRAVAPAAEPAAAAPPAKRLYFLKPESELTPAAREAVTPSDFTDPTQLPASWRSRTDQAIMKLTTADIDQMAAALKDSGISAADALKAVSKNPSLPPNLRIELLTALGKVKAR